MLRLTKHQNLKSTFPNPNLREKWQSFFNSFHNQFRVLSFGQEAVVHKTLIVKCSSKHSTTTSMSSMSDDVNENVNGRDANANVCDGTNHNASLKWDQKRLFSDYQNWFLGFQHRLVQTWIFTSAIAWWFIFACQAWKTWTRRKSRTAFAMRATMQKTVPARAHF